MTITCSSVLLVEDDPNDVLLLGRALRKAGLPGVLQTARDGEDAEAYLLGEKAFGDRERHPLPSLILLDLKLPKLSGFELLGWLRSRPGIRRIPVVVLTSSKEKHDIRRAYELGANAYLTKPAAFIELVELMGSIAKFWLWANNYSDVALGEIAVPQEHGRRLSDIRS